VIRVSLEKRVRRLALVGPPLCGKSVQAKTISDKMAIPSISTGALFREAIATNSELGERVRQIVYSGHLVPDEIVVDVVQTYLEDPTFRNGYLLDGFPRTIVQARFLDDYLSLSSTVLDRVVVLEIREEEIFRRAAKRRKEEQRKDDESDESLMNRYMSYRTQTMQAINYFEDRGIVFHIDGSLSIPQVSENIMTALMTTAP
jgi:adenylate kinase